MSDWREAWRSIVVAMVRRYEAEQDEPWHHDALRISGEFLGLFDRTVVTRGELAALLTAAGKLPAQEGGASMLRRAILRSYLSIDDSEFEPRPVDARQLVIDPYGGVCLVVEPDTVPAASWLRRQQFEPVRTMTGARWWKAYPMRGGVSLLPEPLVFALGRPSEDQLFELLMVVRVEQAKVLLRLFPELPRAPGYMTPEG